MERRKEAEKIPHTLAESSARDKLPEHHSNYKSDFGEEELLVIFTDNNKAIATPEIPWWSKRIHEPS